MPERTTHGPYLRDTSTLLTAESDAFGHRDYATAAVHALENAAPPFTVGLFGAWGIGKSTILEEIKKQFERSGGTLVYFDAWRYEGETFRREFLKDVANNLVKVKALDIKKFDPAKKLEDLYATVAVPVEEVKVSRVHALRALMGYGLVLGLLYLVGVIGTNKLADGKTGDPAVIAFLALLPLVIFLLNKTTDVIQIQQFTVTKQRLEEPERFTERFGELLRAVKRGRLVIAIDNLDRLSPDDAIALLSTIKTYLEPVIGGGDEQACRDVLFLIAADDAALREHLMTRAPHHGGESARDATTDGDGDGDDGSDAGKGSVGVDLVSERAAANLAYAADYADEYLRKFFNASLKLRPVLDDDIFAFMREHLRALAERWEQTEQLDDLVRLCGVGLRHNPRRVKQFVNSLELRLQLIKAREEAVDSKIVPPMSQDLAMVAKLALIEEEWPPLFMKLVERPRLLSDWHEAADRKQRPADVPVSAARWERFAELLRASQTITTSNLRAFLRLRRTAVEAELPNYDSFHEAVTSFGHDGADELFEGVDDSLLDKYALRVVDIVRESLRGASLDDATAAVDAVVALEKLSRCSAAVTRVLEFAVREPDLRPQLVHVTAGPLVAQAGIQEPDTRDAIYSVLIDRYLDEVAANEPKEGLTEALAGAAPQFVERLAARVREAAASESNAKEFSYFLPLMEARPDLLPQAMAANAFDEVIEARTGDEPGVLRGAGDPWRVVLVALEAGVAGKQHEAFATHVSATIEGASAEHLATVIEDVATILPRLTEAPAAAIDPVVSSVIARASDLEHDPRLAAVRVAIDALDRTSEGQREALAQSLAGVIAQGGHLGELADEQLEDELRAALIRVFDERLRTGHADAVDSVVRLDNDPWPRIAEAAAQLAASGYPDALGELLRRHSDELRPHEARIAEPVLGRLEQLTLPRQTDADDVRLIARLASSLTTEQRQRLRAALVLIARGEARPGLDVLLESVVRESFAADLARELVDFLGEGAQNAGAVLSFVLRLRADLSDEQAASVVEHVTSWIETDTAPVAGVAKAAQAVGQLDPAPAARLTKALSAADERGDHPHETRVEIGRAIRAVANNTEGQRADDTLEKYEARLRDGSEEDRAVLRALDARG